MESRRTRWGSCVLSAITLLTFVPGVVSAHTVSTSRFDAPLPLSLLFLGAGGTVALTALWLAVTDRATTTTAPRRLGSISARTAPWLRAAAGALFFGSVVAVIAVGVGGRQIAAENVATVFTWPVWFRGLALLALLIGSPWAVLSPWRTVYRGLCRLEGDQLALRAYPDRLGSWPAVVGFLVLIGVIENLTVIPRSPTLTAVVVASYALAMLGGAICFGPVWFERADPLGVLYGLFGRVAGLHAERSADGGLDVSLRPPWQGCLRPVSSGSVAVFVIAAVYTVSFDGFTNTRGYRRLLFAARDALGTGPPTSLLLYLLGLLVFVAAFVGVVRLVETFAAMPASTDARDDDERSPDVRTAMLAFAPTLLPIAAAYDVAHNYPYVLENAARLLELTAPVAVGDPLGWLPLPVFWGSQVVLLVVGHIVAAVAAHHVAVARFESLSAARRGHLPLVVLMIGYTVLSLWIISQPVVR